MGCSESKGTETKNQAKPKPKKPDNQNKGGNDGQQQQKNGGGKDQEKDSNEAWASREDAIDYVMKDLNVSKEVATKLVDRANKDGDDKIEGNELKELWSEICEAKEEVKPMFEAADANNSGKVTVSEATKILKEKRPKMKEKPMKKLMKSFDDGDGIIQYGEFIVFYYYLKSADKDLRPDFEKCDTSKSGTVTLTEAGKVLQKRFPKMSEHAVKSLLRKYDSGDAKVDYEEFILFYAILKQARSSLTKKFEKLDKNGDGRVKRDTVIMIVQAETGMDKEDCQDLVIAADNDGNNDGNISKEEFIALWSSFC